MSRQARLKFDEGGCYHLYCPVAAAAGEYPLAKPLARATFIALLKFYVYAYCCQIASFQVMGNHYHLVMSFGKPCTMTEQDLKERAKRFYPKAQKIIEAWSPEDWERFQKRIFNVSEFMRNLQGEFAKWYNVTYSRRGHFWADRFKSVMLTHPLIVLACIAYVELNAVRAGLVQRPEDYQGGSLHLRELKADGWLMPLDEICPDSGEAGYENFKALIYYRGGVRTKEGQAVIPPELIERERRRGFARSGVYLEHLRSFVDGVMLGLEAEVREKLEHCRKINFYSRRVNPIPLPFGGIFELREQRSHAREI
jgi:REP element-mobilizing transposase RayT